MDLKQFYLSPQGRVGRQDWWLKYVLVFVVISVVASVLDAGLGLMDPESGYGPVSIIATLVIIYPAIIVTIKRYHDRNKSGWWVLIALIPIVGAIWQIIELGFLRGTVGQNRFGSDPVATPAMA
ncbi:MAG: hypothetical protein K0S81_3792 [Rhodospirillales bacterium]|nr:hypothetical protein [Rhodospirillales bacterium]